MKKRRWPTVVLLVLLLCVVGVGLVYWQIGRFINLTGFRGSGGVAGVVVPDGFQVNIFAQGLNGPRFIAFGPDGSLFVADRGNNRLVRLPDTDGDGTADSIQPFATDLNRPHSLVFHEGAWYVGVPNGVIRLVDNDGDGTADTRTTLINNLPDSGSHTTRTVAFLPDGRLVVSVGSTCNVCEETDARRAAVLVYPSPVTADSLTESQLFATGLRNAVGLAIHPETGALWGSNNGRDLMGDDLPPETIYIIGEGQTYGWPACHNGYLLDPDYGFEGACEGVEKPVVEMQAHSAPLGITFYTGNHFPAEYVGDLFIAFHGSWNRSTPTGYKVVRLPLDGNTPSGPVEDFAVGWMDEDTAQVFGRPVGLAVGPDGALYVSDDKGGVIYRIFYTGS